MHHSQICAIWWHVLTKAEHKLASGSLLEISADRVIQSLLKKSLIEDVSKCDSQVALAASSFRLKKKINSETIHAVRNTPALEQICSASVCREHAELFMARKLTSYFIIILITYSYLLLIFLLLFISCCCCYYYLMLSTQYNPFNYYVKCLYFLLPW